LYPFDSLKLRKQVPSAAARGSLFKGVLFKLVLYSPYQSLYMATYTKMRHELVKEGRLKESPTLVYVVSGVTADSVSAVIRLPMEICKQRIQSGFYKNSWEAIQAFLKSPVSQFYCKRLFVAQTLMHDIPFGIVQWSLYETFARQLNVLNDAQWWKPLVVGTVSGGIAALVTTPLDYAKTRTVIGENNTKFYATFKSAVINRKCFDGAVFRVLHVAPSTGVYFAIFNLIFNQVSSN
jgi:solute carrier family 25 (mitochondrial S-adenosylmethionine transporter), member 26